MRSKSGLEWASGRIREPDDGEVIGRIVKVVATPRGNTVDVDSRLRLAGRADIDERYEVTREAAMQAFAKSWHRE